MILKSFLITTLVIVFTKCEEQLRFVFEIFRHGARAPWNSLNETNHDIFGEQWPGTGELTGVGMRQHYLIGHRNRQRYNKLLSSFYDPQEIYVASTDVNRTIMSAYSQLQGMFPPESGPVLSGDQQNVALPPVKIDDLDDLKKNIGEGALPHKTSVIPIHIFDQAQKYMYLHDSNVCPGVGPRREKNANLPKVKEAVQKFNTTYYEKLSKFMNITPTYLDVHSSDLICDVFIAGYFEAKEFKLLKNAGIDKEEMFKDCNDLFDVIMVDYNFGDDDGFVGTMAMSPVVRDIFRWIDTRITYDKDGKSFLSYVAPKMVLYSAHDTTLTAMETFFMNAINSTRIMPKYASQIYFELYRKDNEAKEIKEEDYVLKIFFNDAVLYNDSYKSFKEKATKVMISDSKIAEFCKFESPVQSSSAYLAAVIGLSVLSGILLIGIIYSCRRKATPNPGYSQI